MFTSVTDITCHAFARFVHDERSHTRGVTVWLTTAYAATAVQVAAALTVAVNSDSRLTDDAVN
jgi:hypothetical protein